MKRRRFDMTKLAESMGTKAGGAWDVPYGEVKELTALQSRVLWAVNFDAIEWRRDPEQNFNVTVPFHGDINVHETILQLTEMKLVMIDRAALIRDRITRYMITDAGRRLL